MCSISIAGRILRYSTIRKGYMLPAIMLNQMKFSSSLSQEKFIEAVATTDKDLVETAVKELLRERINSSNIITDDHIQQSYENFQVREMTC
mmetsp:Transcript_25173/g.38037  ORF Transcript_25173/g.38037 Transcript_25173/m.38037 type:complete len:91 (+) Transcript_25173:127-399(+)